MPNSVGTLLPIFAFDKQNLINEIQQFFAWLNNTNQSYWQILPIHLLPDNQPSPYSSYGLGLDLPLTPSTINSQQFLNHFPYLRDLTLFLTLKQHFQTDQWWTWPQEFRDYQTPTLIEFISQNKELMLENLNNQIASHQTWAMIKELAQNYHIQIIGDLPFYLDRTSPLVWSHQKLFLSPDNPSFEWTSGVPASNNYPRQVWNHPLYNYEYITQIKHLWQIRLHYASQLFDCLRIDHSIGFFHYGQIHTSDSNLDQVVDGPGTELFNSIHQISQFYNLNLIAEDITDFDSLNLHLFLEQNLIPSTRVFTQGITNNNLDPYFTNPSLFNSNSVVYSSNHDTSPLIAWLQDQPLPILETLRHQFKVTEDETQVLARQIISQIVNSQAKIKIIPIQDWILSDQRINTPGQNSAWQLNIDFPY